MRYSPYGPMVGVMPKPLSDRGGRAASAEEVDEALREWWSTARDRGLKEPALVGQEMLFWANSILIGDRLRTIQEINSLRCEFDALKKTTFRKLHRAFCWTCERRADVKHHVVELKNGGANVEHNVVPLCHYCHCRVHPWLRLPRILRGEGKRSRGAKAGQPIRR
jgi:hypothetical protein